MPGKNSKGGSSAPGRVWDLKNIQQLLDLLADKEITEFEMEQQGVKIRVARGFAAAGAAANLNGYVVAPGAPQALQVSVPAATAPPPIAEASAPNAATAPEAAAESTEGLFIMKSPIVGTFYSAPSPSAPPFAGVGETVKVGQVLCIIEAMKLMNELEAEVAGKVVRVYCENGQPVEYGQSLFAIEPARKK
jgi:acetyl-CoA carboxylase biotin carboxyl carrier protein